MILLLDTSSNQLVIALGDSSPNVLTFRHAVARADERGIHDARLALEVEAILLEHELAAKDITRIGIVIGPGSFTGLRIGLAFAKGFASVWDAEIVPIIAHELLADDSLPTDALLSVDGYQPSLVYLARNGSPKEIWLSKRSEIAAERVVESPDITVRLERMLALTIKSEVADIATLEPHYVTEFAVGAASESVTGRPQSVSKSKKSEPKPAQNV